MKIIRISLIFLYLGLYMPSSDAKEPPNILLINIDDMGWRDVGFMGSEYYETPNIDALAKQGVIFTNAYATAANCAPSRACLMSGQWTPRHGIYTVNSSKRGKSKDRKLIPIENKTVLPDSQFILTEALKLAGYITCHAGKWHLNDDPTTQGFDVNIGGSHSGHPSSYYPPYRNVALEAPSDDYYLTNLIMDKTLEFVKSTGKKPFFLYYSPYAVHTPIHPVKDLLPKYESKPEWNGQNNAKYATMVENLDAQIGRLILLLKESGKLDNTFILFISDNGGVYKVTKQWPLRAGKGSYYEGGIREPMFAYWPGKIEGDRKSDVPVTNLDFFPTILEVAGISKPKDKILDGQSILPLLIKNEPLKERPLFWHFPIYLSAGNVETQDPLFRTRPGSAIRLGDWKLIEYFENNDIELYNLKEDIGEKKNLAGSNPEKVKELLTMLQKWRIEINAPVPSELNPEFDERPVQEKKPNILWIVNEDMDPELGCYGNKLVKTPNIDKLASEGALFSRAYAPTSVCSPCRSSFFTGMYNIRIGAHQHRTQDKKPLPEGVKLVTELLADNGYYICNLSRMFKHLNGNCKTDFNFEHQNVFPGEDWNSSPKDKPFFAYVNLPEPKPYLWDKSEVWAKENNAYIDSSKVKLPPYYPDMPKTRKWMAQHLQSISHMDSKVGAIINQLKKDGYYDNTVIIYFSDHGSAVVRHKQWLYETGIRVPLVIRYSEKVAAGIISDDLISLIDVTATTLKIAGVEVPANMDGSVISLFGGKEKKNIYTSRDRCDGTEERIRAVTSKRYKLIRNYRNDVGYVQKNSYYIEAMLKPMPELRRLEREGKLTEVQANWFAREKPFEEFYDLEIDPYEVNNLIKDPAYKEQIEKLRKKLDSWLKSTNDKGKIKENPEIAKREKAKMRERYFHKIDPEVRKYMD